MAGLCIKGIFSFVPHEDFEQIMIKEMQPDEPDMREQRLLKAFKKITLWLVPVMMCLLANVRCPAPRFCTPHFPRPSLPLCAPFGSRLQDVIYGLTEVQGPIIVLRCFSLLGFAIQLIKSIKFECITARENCRDAQHLRLLLQMMLLVRVGQMFSELATMNLDCKIHEDSFKQRPGNNSGGLLDRMVACHMIFGAESTVVTFLYMSVTMLQLEVLRRIETIWTKRAMEAYARGVRHQPDGMIKAAVKYSARKVASVTKVLNFEDALGGAMHKKKREDRATTAATGTVAQQRWLKAFSFAANNDAHEPSYVSKDNAEEPASIANNSSSFGISVMPSDEAADPASLNKHPSRMARAKKANDDARAEASAAPPHSDENV